MKTISNKDDFRTVYVLLVSTFGAIISLTTTLALTAHSVGTMVA